MTNSNYTVLTYRTTIGYIWSWIENVLANRGTKNIQISYYNNHITSSGNNDVDCEPGTIKVFILGWI